MSPWPGASGDTTVAAVAATGLVTAIGGGETRVTSTAGEAFGAALVTVIPTDSVNVSPDTGAIAPGDTLRLVAEALDEDGQTVAGAQFEWSSSDRSVANVDRSGLVRGIGEGRASITATAGDASGTAEITVANPDRAALVALYEATDGPNWEDNRYWLTDAPLEAWHGVSADRWGRVTELSLSSNGLRGSLPREIGSLSRLTRLVLGQNPLTGRIPPEIGILSNLQQLILLYTNLSGPLPPELGDLSALTELVIAQTALVHTATAGSGVDGAIPPELGQLSRLRTLWLHGNGLTGPIPPELGNLGSLESLWLGTNPKIGPGHSGPIPPELGHLSSLERLDLRQNSLSGPLPPELGGLSALGELLLDDNQLASSIPPELGELSNLRKLDVSNNRLTGAVPESFGDLTRLESLGLSFNAGLSGALPQSLTALLRLQTLLTTGTDLCAPGGAAFTQWLNGLVRKRIPSCAADNPPPLYLTQAVQSRSYPVSLVAGDPALLRVFFGEPRAAAAGAHMPPVRAALFLDGVERHVVEIPGRATLIPAEVDEGDLSRSANAEIPGEIVQPGLEMVVEIDPDGTLDPSLDVAKRIPETGRAAVDVRRVPPLELTMVPFLWSTAPDSAIVDLASELTAEHDMFWATRDLLPVGDFELRVHEPVVTSTNTANELMGEARAIRAVEGDSGYWWATMTGSFQGAVGAAGGDGVIWATPYPLIVAHELGHEFDLYHAPCRAPSPDTGYPQPDGSIGAWGYDARSAELVEPGSYDLMSYCRPQWISDFHFSNALGYRTSIERTPQASLSAEALLVWGGVDGEDRPYLEPAFGVDAPPSLPVSSGEYEIAGRDSSGRELFSLRFDMPATTDGDGGSSFAFAVPAAPGWAGSLTRITLTGPGGSATLDHGTDRPMVILRDPASGQVRGFLRGLTPTALVSGSVLAPVLSSGIDVLFSRGIPAPEVWRP